MQCPPAKKRGQTKAVPARAKPKKRVHIEEVSQPARRRLSPRSSAAVRENSPPAELFLSDVDGEVAHSESDHSRADSVNDGFGMSEEETVGPLCSLCEKPPNLPQVLQSHSGTGRSTDLYHKGLFVFSTLMRGVNEEGGKSRGLLQHARLLNAQVAT